MGVGNPDILDQILAANPGVKLTVKEVEACKWGMKAMAKHRAKHKQSDAESASPPNNVVDWRSRDDDDQSRIIPRCFQDFGQAWQ